MAGLGRSVRRLVVISLLVAGCSGQATATPVATLAASAGTVPSNWVAYTAPDDAFSVALPEWPSPSTRTQESAAGPLEVRILESKSFDQETSFLVMSTEYPATSGTPDLDAMVDGALAGADGATLEQSHAIELGAVPGRDYTITGKGQLVRGRVYLRGWRVYSLLVAGSDEGLPNAEAFFASFVIK